MEVRGESSIQSVETRLAFMVMFESSKQKSGSTLDSLIARAESESSGGSRLSSTLSIRSVGSGKVMSLFGGVGLSASDGAAANSQKCIHKMNSISK